MMFGGTARGWVEKQGLTHVDLEHLKSPIITKLHAELQALRADVFESNEWRTHVERERARHAKGGEKDAAAADRSIMACIAQDYEDAPPPSVGAPFAGTRAGGRRAHT